MTTPEARAAAAAAARLHVHPTQPERQPDCGDAGCVDAFRNFTDGFLAGAEWRAGQQDTEPVGLCPHGNLKCFYCWRDAGFPGGAA